ncbi:hypothetical protein K1T71_013503 [Dendrolimus kikuchii]|uniref:Uncharacterized protein n=1 Tax=Dendrolimus kikuchii TaxID=765133 RepID=A0ACC1CGM3_9NEOP|nr:hypothetical protein K1T71_013503 [Dendrolimus kikuchii]
MTDQHSIIMSNTEWKVHGVAVSTVNEINSAQFDSLVVVTTDGVALPQALEDFITASLEVDAALSKKCAVLRCPRVSGNRLVISPTGPITPYDDVRSIYEAARAGIERAHAAGSARPVLLVQPHPKWRQADLVALLGALEALYVPLQIRETFPDQAHKIEALGVYSEGVKAIEDLLKEAIALEISRGVSRDIGGSDPERMTPRATAKYLHDVFQGSGVKIRVVDDINTIEKEYPLFAAVNRAANSVDRHKGCIVFLEYEPKFYDKTVMFVGKGVTYDTGGCDIKAGGVMAGMSRDKCGAAAVAGFLKACDVLKPPIKVVAALGMVRNSVGEQAYVADELIRCRRGLAVRIGNTDAEGRMIMGDLLSEMHDRALNEKNPHIYTVATLTGHAVRAYGDGYTAAMDNHVARDLLHSTKLASSGDSIGDMVEISTIRREDLATHRGKVPGDQVHQAGNCASTACARGHQAPAAFLLLVSGLDGGQVPYTHLDVAASAGCLPDPPTAAPLLALANHYGLISTK